MSNSCWWLRLRAALHKLPVKLARREGGRQEAAAPAATRQSRLPGPQNRLCLCCGTTPRYWHANVASPSGAAWEDTERSPPRSFRKTSALGSQPPGSLKNSSAPTDSDHSQAMSRTESQQLRVQFEGAFTSAVFPWCEHFAMCNAWI